MSENITFSDWSEKLENGTNHWLPAYGFQQPSNLQDRQFEILNDGPDSQQTFLFLETILEETSDDLRSESDYSGPTGWPDSDSDTSSVIHIAEKLNATLRNTEWGGSERDLVVPKKRRRRQLLNSDPGVYDDEEDESDDVTGVPMSRSSSLLQFETLERQCETVFKTTATSEPFAIASYGSHNHHWRFSSSDSLDDNRSTTDSSDDDLSRSYSSRSLKSNNSGLKSYRSFDSLTANQNKETDKSQSLLLSQSLSSNALYIEPEPSEPVPTPRGIYKTVECLTEMSCQHAGKSPDTARAKRSVENLSEDSGFGDHTSTTFPTGEFGSFSLFSAETDKETTDSRGDMNEAEEHATPLDDVKIEESGEEGEVEAWQSAGEEESSGSENEGQSEPEHSASMTSRVPVHSTPNLTYLTESDALFHSTSVSSLSKTYSLKRINFESESDLHASRTSVCSGRGSRVQITTSFVNLSANTFDNGANNNNKVHFSPVVSEVKWDSRLDTASREKIAKDYYSPSCVDAMVKKLFDCEEEEKEGHMDIKCVNVDANEDSVDSRPSCYTMESYQRAIECDEMKSPKHLSKFGEFFQRFSFKRLSGRSSQKRKDEKKSNVSKKPTENSMNVNLAAEDTKIIPNKPPLPPSSRRRPSPVFPQCTVSSSMSAECSDRDGILETDLDSEITTKKAQSLLNLDDDRKPKSKKHPASTLTPHTDYRAKSMEFLLDKENKEAVKPPENELRRERVPSEHELRVQRSLQRLDLPEWYRNHPSLPAQGFLLGKRHSDAGRQPDAVTAIDGSTHPHWPGLASKTTSLSSLGSSAAYSTSSVPRNSPERGMNSTSSTTAFPLFTRWSTSKLNHPSTGTSSSSSSPGASARSSFNHRTPYLGWRYSHERLAKPNTPNERLAASILRDSVTTNSQDNEVRTSIKEVTSAIVHYVSGREQGSADKLHASSRYLHDSSSPSRSNSPKGSTGKVEKCWLESSFIGCRPIEIPPSSPVNNPPMPPDYFLNLNNSFTSSKSAKICPNTNGSASDVECPPRAPPTTSDTTPADIVRCRNNECGKTSDVADARKTFKTCHNCSHVYCSRECRRTHWEKHRKTCLHSRVGALCRRVLTLIKTDAKSLLHVSMLARRGFLSQGRGTVRCLFTSPETAEDYVHNGLPALKDPSYVQWSDLPANDIGSELYAELLKLCKSYNPDTRFVLYVSICVLSEIPTSGAVKWERQLVSRCAKTKLDRSLITKPSTDPNWKSSETPETLILTSVPGCPTPPKSRQICFINIQRHLRLHGVSLRRHFPEVYKNLCAYVEGTLERFTPVTIYPRDSATSKHFMCIIMPDADPEKIEMVSTNSKRVQTIDVSKEIS